MGNQLSNAANTHGHDGASPRPSASSWLLDRLDQQTNNTLHATARNSSRRRRLSSMKDTDVAGDHHSTAPMLLRKPHSLSEATTLSMGDPYCYYNRSRSSGDESISSLVATHEEAEEQEHHPHRVSFWQQVVKLVSAPTNLTAYCCGTATNSPPPSPQRPRRRRRRRRRPPAPTAAEMEEKHRAFWALVQKLLALNDVVAMIRELYEYLADCVGASTSAVFLVDPNHSSMSRVRQGQPTLSSISQQRGLVGHVITTKTSLCRQLFAQDHHYDAEIDLPQDSVFQKLMCVPLLENGNVYAVVQLTTKDPETRSDELDDLDMKLLAWLGPILSSCMRKCIEYHDVLLSDRTQKALLHIISSSDTEDTVLNLVDGVITGASHITKSERLSLFMVDWETQELWTLSSSYHEETIRVPLEGSTLGHVARNRVTLNIVDAQHDPRFVKDLDYKRGIVTRCALYVPVGVENGMNCDQHSRPMAVLEILNKVEGDSFSLDDECAFEAFASEVAVILRRRSNEIEYIKLLADTRAEKVLAQRAKSQVNLLECYTEYVANANANHAADRLRHSFFKSHSRGCLVCTSDQQDGTANCTSIDRANGTSQQTMNHDQATMLPPLPIAVANGSTDADLPLFDFNIFATDVELLPAMVRDMFMDFRVHDILQIDEGTLRNFIFAVRETYHPNPFHNYLHAVSVMHMAYTILKTTDASTMLQPLDIVACLIAAYCHDVDHPGHTNSYEITSKSPLAMLYSDESVLERHHASTTFRILCKDKQANILQNLSTSDYRYLRKMIVTAILSTDMAQHFKMCESMEKMVHPAPHHAKSATSSNSLVSVKRDSAQPKSTEAVALKVCLGVPTPMVTEESPSEIINVVREAVFQTEPSGSTPTTTSTKGLSARALACSAVEPCTKPSPYQCAFNGTLDERTFLVKTVVHAADLSGQTFPKPIALKWSNMVSKEFAFQALLEQAESLPVSFNDVDDPLQMVEGQYFFAHKIVYPLWQLMHQMFPQLEPCVKNVGDNVAHYEHEIQRLKRRQHARSEHATATIDGDFSDSSTLSGDGGLESASWSVSEDEGMAVPGVARCTPAKFNSFRAMKEAGSFSRSVSSSAIDVAVFGAKAIEAIDIARSQSEFYRSRSSSTASSADARDGAAEEEEIFEVGDLDSPKLLSGRPWQVGRHTIG